MERRVRLAELWSAALLQINIAAREAAQKAE